MDEMYEIVHQATYRFFGIDEMYKLMMDKMYEIVWIWIFWNWLKFEYELLQNLRFLSCKSTNFVLVVKPTLISLFWLFGLCLFGFLFPMYDW